MNDSSRENGVYFSPLEGIVRGSIPFGTMWQVQGDSGVGKSTLGYQFIMQGLRQGETAVYVTGDEPVAQVREELKGFGFAVDFYEREGRLVFVDTYPVRDPHVLYIKDRGDAQEFLYVLAQIIRRIRRPCRLVLDSLTSIAAEYSTKDFVMLVQNKNRLLGESGVAIMDIYLNETLAETGLQALSNAYDVCLDLFFTEERGGIPQRNFRVRKLRAASFDPRPYPCSIKSGLGILVDRDYYVR